MMSANDTPEYVAAAGPDKYSESGQVRAIRCMTGMRRRRTTSHGGESECVYAESFLILSGLIISRIVKA